LVRRMSRAGKRPPPPLRQAPLSSQGFRRVSENCAFCVQPTFRAAARS
jgi:hypothetical protein